MTPKLLITIIAGGLFLIAGSVWFGRKDHNYSQYVCANCGLKKSEDKRKFAFVTYRRAQAFENTAVSTALRATDCSHNWLLYSFARGGGHLFRGAYAQGQGSSKAYVTILLALNDDIFAKELAAMSRSSEVWSNLLVSIHTSPQMNESFSAWRNDRGSGGSFSNWWTQVSRGNTE